MKKTTIIASAVAFALGISACSEQKTLAQMLASANEYSEKRDFASAVIELKNAVRLSPKNAEARLALGQAYLEQGDFLFAEKELEKSLQLGMDLSHTAPMLARVKAKLAKYDEVQKLVEQSTDLNDIDYITVLTYAGVSALAHNEREKAQDYIGQAISISENAVYSQIGKAYLAQSEQDYAQSLINIEALLAKNPNVSEAVLLKAHLLFSLKDYEQAAETFSQYLTQHPLDYSIRFFAINSLIKAQLFKQAEVITDKLLAKFKAAPLALHYKAQLLYQQKNFKDAKSYAEQAIQAGATLPLTKIIAGISAYQLKDYEQAYNHLKPIEPYLPNNHPIQKVIAVVKLQLGYSSEATESIMALEGLSGTDSAFLQSSTASLIALGDLDSAQQLIEKAEQIDPNNAKISAQKGLILLSQNDDSAIDSLERAIELDPSLIEVELALGIQYLKAGDDNKAKNIAQKLIIEQTNNASGYILQGVIYTKEKNKDKAIASFNKALSFSPNNVASLYNLGLILKDEEDVGASMDYFEQVIKLASTHKGALSNYVSLAAKNKLLERSNSFLQGLSHNENLVLTIALAQSLRLNSQIKEASTLLENFADKEAINTVYWVLLGDLYLQQKNIVRANKAYSAGLTLDPRHYLLYLRSIGMFELLKKYPEALAQTKSAYEYYPNDARLEILLAYFELRNSNTGAAKEMLNVIENKSIKHQLVDSISGRIALLDKDYAQAIEYFSAAYEQKPSADNAIQLARSLKFSGKQRESEKTLESFVENNSTNIKVRFLLAELYSTEEKDKKIAQYQAINDVVPDNIVALNNLSWNQYKVGDINAALVNIEKAYKIEPENLTVIETYGVVLEAASKYDYAIKMLEKALASGSSDKLVQESLVKAKASLKR